MKNYLIIIGIALTLIVGAFFIGKMLGGTAEAERINAEVSKRIFQDSIKIEHLNILIAQDSAIIENQRKAIDAMSAEISRSDAIITGLLNRKGQIKKQVSSYEPLELEYQINNRLRKRGLIK